MEKEKTNSDLVTVFDTNQHAEALAIKDFLEDAGIMVFLQNELTAQIYANAAGGISIQVPDIDAEKARNLLIEAGYIK
jgi:ribosome-interacting GTPase 1